MSKTTKTAEETLQETYEQDVVGTIYMNWNDFKLHHPKMVMMMLKAMQAHADQVRQQLERCENSRGNLIIDLAGAVKANTGLPEDVVDKIECMYGYLKLYADGKSMPHELPAVVQEVGEWLEEAQATPLPNPTAVGDEQWLENEAKQIADRAWYFMPAHCREYIATMGLGNGELNWKEELIEDIKHTLNKEKGGEITNGKV